ncbi:MAG TPA: hypothetical protein VG873_03510 [Burkholderiales bacterium]|nr:hypothetical protein [Burkholderiales bacterium]
MSKRILLAASCVAALAAAVPASFAQTAGQPGTSLGVPSTGSIVRPGDTTLPGTPTTPGLSTLPGAASGTSPGVLPPLAPSTPGPSVLPNSTDPLDRNSSTGATRPPFGSSGTSPRPMPGCVPGSVTNPC